VMGGIHPAYEIIMEAIKHGKQVVTANKALLAEHGNELFKAAEDNAVQIAYEAAVAGGIPIIKVIREGLAANHIQWLAGIINGTGNFILTEMREKGRAFDDVLKEAQELGYAEADPTFDVEGIDAAHKLTILASCAFGIPLQFNKVYTEGISKITAQGYANESAWARGQAWGLYAYTMCYRYTKDKKYLDFAEKIGKFILTNPNYPQDGVPYWDFNAPNIPNAPRDASSGAILASGLIELSTYTNDKYLKQATHILKSLASDDYTAKLGENGNFVLKNSVGSLPMGNEVSVPLNYADYYYIEALMELKKRGI